MTEKLEELVEEIESALEPYYLGGYEQEAMLWDALAKDAIVADASFEPCPNPDWTHLRHNVPSFVEGKHPYGPALAIILPLRKEE